MTARTLLLARFGTRVGTRGEGRAAQEAVWNELSSLPAEAILTADLTGVEVLSGSFADEALVAPTARLVAGELPGRYLLIATPAEDLVEDLAAKLDQRKLALLAVVREDWHVLGRVPPYLGEALAWVISRGETTSADLSQGLGISLSNASTRLAELARLRLIRLVPESRPAGGILYRGRSLVSVGSAP